MEDIQLGQGRENSRTLLQENPDIADSLEIKIREKLEIPGQGDTQEEPGEKKE